MNEMSDKERIALLEQAVNTLYEIVKKINPEAVKTIEEGLNPQQEKKFERSFIGANKNLT